jgi:ABC-2 type transport system permease protein
VSVVASANWAGVAWTGPRLAMALLAPICGALLFGSIFVGAATVAFWWIDSGEVANSVTYGGRDFCSYPIPIYEGVFRRVFAYGFGFAFTGYYPALVLLGRPDPLRAPDWLGWCAPAVGAAAVVAAAAAWRGGIRHYRSTGS